VITDATVVIFLLLSLSVKGDLIFKTISAMKIQQLFPVLLMLALVHWSCTPRNNMGDLPEEVQGMVPVYTQENSVKAISTAGPRPTVRGGKIYTTGNYLLQVEQDSGIHVINYANPQSPQKIGFIRSFLCKELTMKDGFLYTNNLSDLVVIDIRNINAVQEVGRVTGVFPDLSLQYPSPQAGGTGRIYFECPDPSKGVIARWEQRTIKNPTCWR
jgi:hypothetical protein